VTAAALEAGYSSDSETRRAWLWHRRLAPSSTSSALLELVRGFGRYSSMRLAQLSLAGARGGRRSRAVSFCRRTVTCIFPEGKR